MCESEGVTDRDSQQQNFVSESFFRRRGVMDRPNNKSSRKKINGQRRSHPGSVIKSSTIHARRINSLRTPRGPKNSITLPSRARRRDCAAADAWIVEENNFRSAAHRYLWILTPPLIFSCACRVGNIFGIIPRTPTSPSSLEKSELSGTPFGFST